MEVRILGDPSDSPTLALDHERFAYAGKFVISNTGKAVAESPDGDVLGATAFNADRTDSSVAWIRYVTTRTDRRGEGIGSELLAETASYLLQEFARVRIAVNNPYAYVAAYKAGFEYTGTETGLAEFVLERPGDRTARRYRDGLAALEGRDSLSEDERQFVSARIDGAVPDGP